MKISEQLKSSTAKLHERLEALMFSDQIMNGSLSKDQYIQMLQVQYAIVAPFEQIWKNVVTPNEAIMILWQERYKTPFLKKDIYNLDVKPQAPEMKLFQNWSYPELLGAAYVIEGSTLGGKMISKKLETNPEIPKKSTTYFNHYGSSTGSKWKSFLDFLNSHTKNHDNIIDGANKTFLLFIEKAMIS